MNVSLGIQLRSLRKEIGRLHSEAPALSVTLDAPDEALADLLAAVEVACYRIVTEALTNVTRHAHATHCMVRIGLSCRSPTGPRPSCRQGTRAWDSGPGSEGHPPGRNAGRQSHTSRRIVTPAS